MEKTKFIWMNGEMVPWDNAKIHVICHGLHYGSAVFEGLRVYDTEKGPAIFRLKEHTNRLFYSAEALKMQLTYSKEEINKVQVEVVRKNELRQGYIRPIIYYGYGKMGINPKGADIDIAIACWAWGAYLPQGGIDIKITPYIRIHPDSTICDAKISGHYVNSILSIQALDEKYHEAILLDFSGRIAEGPGENIFIVKDGKLLTPKLGAILNGITRATIFEIAKKHNIPIEEVDLYPKDVINADEAFYTGSAAEVTPIRSLDDTFIGDGNVGPITTQIKDQFMDIVYGRDPEFEHYLTYVS